MKSSICWVLHIYLVSLINKNIFKELIIETELATYKDNMWQAFDATERDVANDQIQDNKIRVNKLGNLVFINMSEISSFVSMGYIETKCHKMIILDCYMFISCKTWFCMG